MKKTAILLCLVFAACSSGGSAILSDSFYDLPVGSSQEQVIAAIGKPTSVHQKEDGTVEYEYIERFKVGGRNLNERRYYILMKDGKVVSKWVKQTSPLPYGFDSYEMQTTHNHDDASLE